MADVVDKATRSRMMAGVRGKDTAPELVLRRALHAQGFRFRLHDRALPGRPDIVLKRYNAVILVHGCFWHRHSGCRFATTPATRTEFWRVKFDGNVDRDARDIEQLLALGFRVAVVWECALKPARRESTTKLVSEWIRSGDRQFNSAP